jgi:hypothetical protein
MRIRVYFATYSLSVYVCVSYFSFFLAPADLEKSMLLDGMIRMGKV